MKQSPNRDTYAESSLSAGFLVDIESRPQPPCTSTMHACAPTIERTDRVTTF
jgi:hypothetical protein